MADLRFRQALRQYLSDPSPHKAEVVLQAAIRAGIIETSNEPHSSPFTDYAIGVLPKGVYRRFLQDAPDAANWIVRNDTEWLNGAGMYMVGIADEWEQTVQDVEGIDPDDIQQEWDDEDGNPWYIIYDRPPQEVQELLDQAAAEGFDYVAFE